MMLTNAYNTWEWMVVVLQSTCTKKASPSNFCADATGLYSSTVLVVFVHPLPLAYCFQYLLLGGTSCGTRAPEGTRFGPRLSLTFLLPGQPLQRSQTSRTLSHVLVGNMSLWIIIKGQCWQCRESLRAHFLPRQSAGAG